MTLPAVRVAAILHPYENDRVLKPFRLAGANVFRGNSLEPGDMPDAAIVFGGDGSVHRVIQALAGTQTPLHWSLLATVLASHIWSLGRMVLISSSAFHTAATTACSQCDEITLSALMSRRCVICRKP